jgi:hypothetical protein
MKRGGVGIPLTGLPLPHFCACPKPGPGFPMLYVMLFLCSMILRGEVTVCFVDIGDIVDHCCMEISKIYIYLEKFTVNIP